MIPAHTRGAIQSERCSQNSRFTSNSMVFMRPPSAMPSDAPPGCIIATNRSATEGVRTSPIASSSARLRPSNSIAARPNTSRSSIGLSARAALDVSGRGHQLGKALAERFHGRIEHDLAVLDEDDVGEDVLDLLDLVRGDEDGAFLVEIVIQQVVVEGAAEQQVEAERRLVEHQQPRVDGQDQRQVQLRDHALGELAHATVLADVGLGEKFFGALAIEARVDAGDEIQRLRDFQPARQHRDVCDEAHLVHELVALGARIAAEHLELTVKGRETRGRP